MRAVLRRLHSPDVFDLRSWQPDREAWELLVQAFLGPEDGPGEESFDFVVSSPEVPVVRVAAHERLWTQRVLFLRSWDYAAVEAAIDDLLDECTGPDWPAVAAQLARYMDWEFANYRSG